MKSRNFILQRLASTWYKRTKFNFCVLFYTFHGTLYLCLHILWYTVFVFTHFMVHCICVLFLCQAGHTTKTRFVQFWHLADSPHVVSFLHCVVHLLPGEPKLPQHPLKAVALGRWHQLLWSNETVGKTRDDLVVRDLELLQVSKQHLALLPEAAMGNEDNGTIHLKIYKIGQFGQNLNMFTSPNQSMKVTSASSRSRQGKGSFRRAL